MPKKPKENENVENLILEHLRALREEVAVVSRGQKDMIARQGSLENRFDALRSDFTRLEHRFDNMEAQVMLIGKRLNLVDA